jgi:hypothetical protein
VHSSKIITMSEFSTCWMRIDSLRRQEQLAPSIGEENLTPSSVILRSAPSENTWKPPESVRIGRPSP